jgi:hypothetical protein
MNLTKKEWLLLVLFLALLAFPLQYLLRSLDLSTLTSWRWVFAGTGPARIFMYLAIGTVLVMFLSHVDLPEKFPEFYLFLTALLSSIQFLNTPESLLDSARYFLQAKFLAQHGIQEFLRAWGEEIAPWTDLPLVPMLYGLLFKLFGEEKQIIALYNSLLFSLVPVLTFYTGRLLWDRATAFIAGLLVLGSPYLFTQVPLLLVDVHTMFFLLLAVYLFLYTLEQGGVLLPFVSALAICLALFSKYSTWPMLGVLGIIAFISMRSRPLSVLRRSVAVLSMVCILLGILYLWKGDVILQQLYFLRTYQMGGLQRWQEGYLSAFFFQAHPFLILAALFGWYRAVVKRDTTILIPAWFAFLVFLLELKRVRYLLPLLPFLALTASYGLQGIQYIQIRRYIAYCCVISSLVIGLFVYRPFLAGTSMANLKDAGKYIDTLSSEAVEVYCLPQLHSFGNTAVAVPLLDLYTDKNIYQQQPWNSAEGKERALNESLRFTWELMQPDSYRLKKYSGRKLPLVIIASAPVDKLPFELQNRYPGAKLQQKFIKSSGVFRYQAFVSVFDPL